MEGCGLDLKAAERTARDGAYSGVRRLGLQESFEAFGETLLPIMGALGADPGQPHVRSVHNIVKG
jgi:hypothetical protein